ncbi:MAG: FkbM family methyltransferase [Cytophagales bacterium]|nr:FkbM family methyltransferase [Cytophagales bacterium]
MFENLLNKLRRKKEFKPYEFRMVEFDLEQDGKIEYAQWLHPGESGNTITQAHVDFYRQFVKPGDLVIDIGANEGDTSVPMALAAGKEGLTLALEPNPHVFKVLTRNASLNRSKTTIEPLNFAATAYDGEFTFGSGDPSYGNGGIVGFTHNEARNTRFTLNVTGRNLEQYLLKNYPDRLARLSFIKIDTEGYDKEIIKTMPAIIQTHKPVIVTECFGPSITEEKKELYRLLVQHGYTLYHLTDFLGSAPRPLAENQVSGKRTFDILALPERG